MKKYLKILFAFLLLIGALAAFIFLQNSLSLFKDSKYNAHKVERPAYNFRLQNHKGEPVSLANFLGQNIFITFGYSECKTVCPANMAVFKDLRKQVKGLAATRFEFLFVDIDHENTTKEKLNHFLEMFNIDVVGLIGGEDKTLDVARKYNAFVDYNPRVKEINHPGFIYFVDKKGVLQLIYLKSILVKEIINDLEQMKRDGFQL